MPLTRLHLAAVMAIALWPSAAAAFCEIDVAPVAFGTIDVTADSTGTGMVTVDCDAPVDLRVGIAGSGKGTWEMTGPGSATLDYRLYQNAGRTVRWGNDDAHGAAHLCSSDGKRLTRLTIYGLIPAQPDTPPGTYTDSLQVTVTF